MHPVLQPGLGPCMILHLCQTAVASAYSGSWESPPDQQHGPQQARDRHAGGWLSTHVLCRACFPLFTAGKEALRPFCSLKAGVCPAHPPIFSAPVGNSVCPAPQASPDTFLWLFSLHLGLSSLNSVSGSQPCLCLQSGSCRWHQCLSLLYFLTDLRPSLSSGDKSCTATQ